MRAYIESHITDIGLLGQIESYKWLRGTSTITLVLFLWYSADVPSGSLDCDLQLCVFVCVT